MHYNFDQTLEEIKELTQVYEEICLAAQKLPPTPGVPQPLVANYIRQLQDKVERYKEVVEVATKLSTDQNSTPEVDKLVLIAMDALDLLKTF